MPIQPGTRLGPYEILQSLGAGGMGEVYRARDSKLDRDVAIKVLPPLLAEDPAALARFEREAKSVAHLSHPNILGIFDFGRDGSTAYAVMELLEGETLRERLTAGPLSARKVVEYGVQVAHGLAAAHDKGIVHRDIKPENLFITREDRVKILDFGIAKPLDLAPSALTVANGVGTAVGTIMGTIDYMAPEQVRAHVTDHRSDVFSFGAVLHEMVTRRPPFGGDSAADTISAILTLDPPELDPTGTAIPPALDRIIRRCLEKKPELRFQSAHDLAFALETVTTRPSGALTAATVRPALATSRRMASLLPWGIAAAGVGSAVAAWALWGRVPAREVPWQHFTAITDAAGVETAPSLSPDGQTVAYATQTRGTWDIYAQRVGGATTIPIAADPEQQEAAPSFSPDGLSVAYHHRTDDGGVFVAGATGEASRRVTDFGFHPSWSPDGKQLAFNTEDIVSPETRLSKSTMWIVSVNGGAAREVKGTGDAAQPVWSPSGVRIAYWSNTGGQRDLYTIAAGGGTRVPVTNDAALDWCPVWSPDGKFLYFASDRGGSMNLWRIAIDEATGQPRGTPEAVVTGVQAWNEMPSFSKSGDRLVFRSAVNATNPVAVAILPEGSSRAGDARVLNNSNTSRIPSDVSPDGRRLAFGSIGERQEDIFVSAVDGSGLRRVTNDEARDRSPQWSRDGKSLYFYSNREGEWAIWAIGVDGGRLRKIAAMKGGILYPLLSPRGDRLVVSSSDANAPCYIGSADGAHPEDLRPLPGTGAGGTLVSFMGWSPDGSRLVGQISAKSGRPIGFGVYDLASSRIVRRYEIPAQMLKWMPDGRHVVFSTADGKQLMMADTATERPPAVIVTEANDSGDTFAITPDGRTVIYGKRRKEADIWLVERK